MHAAGGVDAFLEEHAVIVMSDHSQTTVEDRVNLAEAFAALARAHARRTRRRPRPRSPSAPPRARPWSTCSTRPPRRAGAAARWTTLLELEGVDLVVHPASEDGARCASGAGELRFRPGRRAHRSARRGAGRVEGDARRAAAGRRRAATVTSDEYPDALGPALVGARRARTRATCSCRPRPATSSWTGAAPTTWAAAATARCTATTRRACCCCAGMARPGPRAVVARGCNPTGARPLPCTVDRMSDERRDDRRQPPARRARPRARRAAQAAQLACSWRSSARSAGSGYVVNLAVFALCVEVLGIHHLVAATAAFVVAVVNNFWWNRHWTFAAPRAAAPASRPPRFFAVSVGRLPVRAHASSSCW